MSDERRLDVSVITVTYRSVAFVEAALRSARAAAEAAGLTLELIVVDNASDDGSAALVAERFPSATLIRNPTNVGFGTANNQAFALASGEAWLLLNPDAQLAPAALGLLVDALRTRPAAGAVAPSIGGPRGGAESAGMRPSIRSMLGHFLFLNRLLPGDLGGSWRGFQLRRRTGLRPRRVEWASAACLLLRPAAVRPLGGFDETIFLYAEDIELCERLVDAGWQIWLEPAATATHEIAGSQATVSTRWVDGLHTHEARHAGRFALLAFDLTIALGLLIRGLATPPRTESERARQRMLAGARRAFALAFRRAEPKT
jgi:N-acetylglucosaminyl-diphospho-decaprenol L-rhamnosyltransferase